MKMREEGAALTGWQWWGLLVGGRGWVQCVGRGVDMGVRINITSKTFQQCYYPSAGTGGGRAESDPSGGSADGGQGRVEHPGHHGGV